MENFKLTSEISWTPLIKFEIAFLKELALCLSISSFNSLYMGNLFVKVKQNLREAAY